MHSLKSSCRQFGAMRLGGLAEKIETYARENNMSDSRNTMSTFTHVHEQTEQLMGQHSGAESQTRLVWDKSEALARMGGKKKCLDLLIKMFIDDVPERVNNLQQAIDNKQSDEAVVHAHTIKGMVGNLGGKTLQQLATGLEEAGNAGDTDRLNALWPGFFDNYQLLFDILQQEIHVQITELPLQNGTSSTIDSLSLSEQLQQLVLNLQQGDYVDPETITDLQSLLPTDQHEKLLRLNEQVSRFDTDAAIETLMGIASAQQITLSTIDNDSRISGNQG